MDLINSFSSHYVYECLYEFNGRRYEFACDEKLEELDVCVYKEDIVIVVKVKSKSEQNYKGTLAKLRKVKKSSELF